MTVKRLLLLAAIASARTAALAHTTPGAFHAHPHGAELPIGLVFLTGIALARLASRSRVARLHRDPRRTSSGVAAV